MKNEEWRMKNWLRGLIVVLGLFFASGIAYALDPTLIIISPAPGEVVESNTVNAIIDTDVALAPTLESPGYFVELWLDAPTSDPTRAVATVNRGYIFKQVKTGLHTLHVIISDRTATGETVRFAQSSVDFEVAPPEPVVPGLGPISWFSVLRDGVIFSFPIIGLALLFLWMTYLIKRKR